MTIRKGSELPHNGGIDNSRRNGAPDDAGTPGGRHGLHRWLALVLGGGVVATGLGTGWAPVPLVAAVALAVAVAAGTAAASARRALAAARLEVAHLQADAGADLDDVADLAARTSTDGIVVRATPGLAAAVGRPVEAVVGRSVADLFDGPGRDRVDGLLRGVAASGGSASCTAALARTDRTTTWVEVTARARSTGPDGSTVAWVDLSLQDITRRRWAERELVRQSHLLDSLTSSAPIGIFALAGTRWSFANQRLSEISGLPLEALHEGRLWEVVHPDDRLQLEVDRATWTSAQDAAQHEVFAGGHYRLVRPDGEARWIQLRMAPVEGSDGQSWVGTVEDTTNEVTARQHTSLLATVVAGTTDLVAIMDPGGDLRFLNPAGRDLLGLGRADDVAELHARHLFGDREWARLLRTALPEASTRGSWSGDSELWLAADEHRPVSLVVVAHRDAVGRIDRLSLLARDTSTQKAVERRLARAAAHDQLTGLPNRSHFNEALTRSLTHASRTGSSVALLFCDLDRFKVVNDSHGHAAGDHLLREVAARLSAVLRGGDLAARVGGDEFLVLADDIDDVAEALLLAERIREALEEPVGLPDGPTDEEVHLSFSIGVALSQPRDTPTQLISRADAAMYRAKALGKNRVQLHDPTRPHRTPPDAVTEQTLRRAIEDGQLQLHYQPIVDLRSVRVTGCEALVRWLHPDLGLLQPDDFIALAEEAGLIRPLGRWVVAEAIRQAGAWADDPTMPHGLQVSLNISALELVDGDLAERTATMMGAARLPADSLCVELTERALAGDEAVARAELHTFRDLGVRVAVDDFGTGYASLAQLRRFPVDVLKMDVGFVSGLGGSAAEEAIVSTVQALADALGLSTIAEGVETPGQMQALRALGCRSAQGFLLSRPLPAEEFAGWARRGVVDQVSAGPRRADVDVDGDGDLPEDAFSGHDHRL